MSVLESREIVQIPCLPGDRKQNSPFRGLQALPSWAPEPFRVMSKDEIGCSASANGRNLPLSKNYLSSTAKVACVDLVTSTCQVGEFREKDAGQ